MTKVEKFIIDLMEMVQRALKDIAAGKDTEDPDAIREREAFLTIESSLTTIEEGMAVVGTMDDEMKLLAYTHLVAECGLREMLAEGKTASVNASAMDVLHDRLTSKFLEKWPELRDVDPDLIGYGQGWQVFHTVSIPGADDQLELEV